jgi:hypothetical protein
MACARFRHADPEGFVSLRAFYDDETRVFAIEPFRFAEDLDALVATATVQASRAARCPRPVVFAPPIATFASDRGAAEADLQNGLALSVECDQAAQSCLQQAGGAAWSGHGRRGHTSTATA